MGVNFLISFNATEVRTIVVLMIILLVYWSGTKIVSCQGLQISLAGKEV